MAAGTAPRRSAPEIAALDPYAPMADIGKRAIRPGGRRSTEAILARASSRPEHRVLDVGCGVGTTAGALARRFGCRVTAVDIALPGQQGRGPARRHPDPRPPRRSLRPGTRRGGDDVRGSRALVPVCRPGGRVLATEFLWRKPPTPEARQVFLGEVCPGLNFDTLDGWVRAYEGAGLRDLQVESGPSAMTTPTGFLADEGVGNSLAIIGRVLARPPTSRRWPG